jgi:hypothetical protein
MKKSTVVLLSTVLCASLASAKVQHVFEPAKDTSEFTDVEWNWKAALSFYYQGLTQDYTPVTGTEEEIGNGLILPNANLDIYAKIMSGFNVKLQTMLSSSHHPEAYVKGGYATIDNLDFIAPGFLEGLMANTTIKIGVNDINFGDDHYRRTDNADVMRNPFVGNLAVESYMQAFHVEVLHRLPTLNAFVMGGLTNGKAQPNNVVKSNDTDDAKNASYALYGKVGFDKQLNDALRVRVTESVYWQEKTARGDLYSGDKSGDVFANIFGKAAKDTSQQTWNAVSGYADIFASKTNFFVKYNDTEFYGLYEIVDGKKADGKSIDMNHYAFDIVQRFANDRFYLAARYENAVVKHDDAVRDYGDAELTQYQLTAGWFLSKNAVAKAEYIKHERKNFSDYGGNGKAEFDGFMISAALNF